MEELDKYHKDKATVISIIKFILIFAVSAVALFFATKFILILTPFLLGFVLAKASHHIGNGIIRIQLFFKGWGNKLSKKRNKNTVTKKSTNPSKLPQTTKSASGFWPSSKKKKLPKRARISVIVFAVLLILTLFFLISISTLLIVQVRKVVTNISTIWMNEQQVIQNITDWLDKFTIDNGGFIPADRLEGISSYLSSLIVALKDSLPGLASSLIDGMLNISKNLPALFFSIIVMIMSGYYFLTDNRMVYKFLTRNIKSKAFLHKSIRLLNRLSSLLFRVLGGYLSIFLITFLESFIFFLIAQVPYSVILALVAAFLDFLPLLGISATFIPLIIYSIIQGNYFAAIVLVIGLVIISIVRRVIEPPILGSAMQMHPLATLFAMIVGVAIWGVVGFILGPVVLLITVEFIRAFGLDKKSRDWIGNLLNRFAQD